ncbi:MAG: glutamate formimidoyltransferase [Nitrospira sp.]|nr:glutamate formimidoyltransferase [Nitrospira sp.]MBP6605914.1 glutamate formimidoyltransferase [Nitrospira sp.]HQY57347.1 glutamate formimidoyltransferase [Nitrospira sp.]HRA96339.1 glutamate formimidoyltransferase [Nitrospira sp.]
MSQVVECVPNFSEGRNAEIVDALAGVVRSVPGAVLLDYTKDPDHHRAVVTFAGRPYAVAEVAFQMVRRASQLIDLRTHHGEHPRVGATDVIPFVPIRGVSMQECVQLARMVGQRIGNELKIPVFLYEQAATTAERIQLEWIRKGGLKGLADRMASDPAWAPDFGPTHLHQTAGATVVGARWPLIAFNVNLKSRDLSVAKAIAKSVRQSSGGLPFVKAIGVELTSQQLVQVSMNLTNHEETPLHVVFAAVQHEATARGVEVAGTEIVGLVPEQALMETAQQTLCLTQFDGRQVLEARLDRPESREAMGRLGLSQPSKEVSPVSTKTGVAAGKAAESQGVTGGSVGAESAAFAAGLGMMVAKLNRAHAVGARLAEIRTRLHELAEADREAYAQVLQARKLPITHPDRPLQLSLNLLGAIEKPLEIVKVSCELIPLLRGLLAQAKPELQPDLKMGLGLANAVIDGCLGMIEENMKIQPNQLLIASIRGRFSAVEQMLVDAKSLCYTPPFDSWAQNMLNILKLR